MQVKQKKFVFYSFILSIILIAAFAYFLQTKIIFSPDVGYLLLAANQMLAGGHYAKTFFETNPPMILYLYFPVCLFTHSTAISIFTVFRLYIISLSLMSAGLSFFLLKKLLKKQEKVLFYFLFYTLLFITLFLPLIFGQREHLLLILMLPYLFSAALALEKKTISRPLAFFIGLLAGLGFAIKPFFLTVPVLIEAYFILKQRNLLAWVRTESIVIFCVLVSYSISIVLFQPEYIHIINPLLFRYYFPGAQDPWHLFIALPNVLFCFSMIISYCFIKKYDRYPMLGNVLFLALIGMVIAFLIPRAPWYYHVLPAFGLGILLLVYMTSQAISGFLSFYLVSVIEIMILFLPLHNCYQFIDYIHQIENRVPSTQINTYFSQHKILPINRSISCFGIRTIDCFPLVYLTKSHYSSRYPAFWWFIGLRALEKKNQPVARDKNYFMTIIATDLTQNHTQLVLINEKEFKKIENNQFDIVHYLSENKNFREAWRHYQYLMTVHPYKIYYLKAQGDKGIK